MGMQRDRKTSIWREKRNKNEQKLRKTNENVEKSW